MLAQVCAACRQHLCHAVPSINQLHLCHSMPSVKQQQSPEMNCSAQCDASLQTVNSVDNVTRLDFVANCNRTPMHLAARSACPAHQPTQTCHYCIHNGTTNTIDTTSLLDTPHQTATNNHKWHVNTVHLPKCDQLQRHACASCLLMPNPSPYLLYTQLHLPE